MPTYRYHARDARGLAQAGSLASASAAAAAAQLRGRGLLVLQVEEEAAGPPAPAARVTWNPLTWLPATSFDVEVGLQQLASMLVSGLSLLSGLRIVAEQARRPRAAAAWDDVCRRIEQGSTFSAALAAHPRVFTPHVVQLARVGEHAGTLDTVLLRAAEHLERARNLRVLVMNAMTYPAVVLLLSFAVAGFMAGSVIPKIQRFLGGKGRALPPATQLLLDATEFLQRHGAHLGIGALALLVGVAAVHRWPPGRRALDGLLLRLPVVGGTLRLAGTALFARGLGLLLESGVTLLDALDTVRGLMGNRALAERVARARAAVLRGESLAGTLLATPVFRPMLGRMVAVGESAGTLAPVLAEVARFHENQLVVSIRRMSLLIEPVVTIVVGAIVGFVYYAFFTALFSLASGVR